MKVIVGNPVMIKACTETAFPRNGKPVHFVFTSYADR